MPDAKPKPYVVRNSSIHGRGVFATRTIRKGAKIIEYRGQRTTGRSAASARARIRTNRFTRSCSNSMTDA